MSETFTKLFGSLTDSTVWAEDNETRILWITMLAMADRHGYVGASIPGLAARARIPVEAVESALAKFLAPDRYSRSQEYDGRRIEVADRGWNLLNYARFRDMRDEEARKEYERHRKREQRARQVPERPGHIRDVPDCPAVSAQAEAEAEAEEESETLPRATHTAPPASLPMSDPEPPAPARPPAKPRKPRKTPDSGHHAILAAYVQAHLQHRGIAPVIAGPEVRAVKAMRAAKPADVETAEAWDAELERLVDLYVASTDEWRERQGWGLRFMPGQITKLRQEARGIDADYPDWMRRRDEEIDRRVTAQQAAEAEAQALEERHTRPPVDAETRAAMRADFEALQAAEAERQAAREAETEVGLRAALDATQPGDRTW